MIDAAVPPGGARYRGAEIEGIALEPDRREIHGRSVTNVTGNVGFAESALWALGDMENSAIVRDDALQLASTAASAGADPAHTETAGLCAAMERFNSMLADVGTLATALEEKQTPQEMQTLLNEAGLSSRVELAFSTEGLAALRFEAMIQAAQ